MISNLLILTYKIEIPTFRLQVHCTTCLKSKTKLENVKLKLTKTKLKLTKTKTRKCYKTETK